MGQPTSAPSCPDTTLLQSAPSLAYQEYCTIISFFSACSVIHFSRLVFCVTMETGGAPKPWEDGWMQVFEEAVPAGQRSLRQESSSKWKEGITWSDLTVCPEHLRKHRPSRCCIQNELFIETDFSEISMQPGLSQEPSLDFYCKKITEVTLTYVSSLKGSSF